MQETPPETSPFPQWDEPDREDGVEFVDPNSGNSVLATQDGSRSLVRHRQSISVGGLETAIDIAVQTMQSPPFPAAKKQLAEIDDVPDLVGLAIRERDDEAVIDFFVCDRREHDDETIEALRSSLQSDDDATLADDLSANFDVTLESDVDESISIDVHPRLRSDVISHD